MLRPHPLSLAGAVLVAAGGCAAPAPTWTPLLAAGETGAWRPAEYGGEAELYRRDGALVLERGAPLAGIVWTGETLPREDYELEVVAARLDGSDFFAAVTFPVGESACTFVPGGWGGATTGLSNVDGADASGNSTTRYVSYRQGEFYTIRIRVDREAVRVWLDGELLVDQPRAGHVFGIRPEMEPCRPLGIAAWACRAAVRSARIRRLP